MLENFPLSATQKKPRMGGRAFRHGNVGPLQHRVAGWCRITEDINLEPRKAYQMVKDKNDEKIYIVDFFIDKATTS